MVEERLTRENCERVLSERRGTVLLDFFADWCVHCKRIAPAVRALARERGDALRILEIDIDALPELAARYGVEAVPTFVLLRDGEIVDVMVAPGSKAALDAFVDAGLD